MFVWSYLDSIENDVKEINHTLQQTERNRNLQEKQKVIDQITPARGRGLDLQLEGISLSKDYLMPSQPFSLVYWLGILSLAGIGYFVIDVVTAGVALFGGVVGYYWLITKPVKIEFQIYNNGLVWFDRFYPWGVFTSYTMTKTNGFVDTFKLNLKANAGTIPIRVANRLTPEVNSLLHRYL